MAESGDKVRPTSVYIIECAGYTKIGVAVDPFRRLAGINTGAPVPAVLYGSRQFETRLTAHEIESRLHRQFRALRTNGEWFDLKPDVALMALRKAKPHKLRDPSARSDSLARWDLSGDGEDLAALLTTPMTAD